MVTVISPVFKWKRGKTFAFAMLLACVAFIPSCAGIMAILDSQRFGVFEYDTFAKVNDFRVERYLPPSATSITMEKKMNGFRARFSITESELLVYLDKLWNQNGDQSIRERGESSQVLAADREYHELQYGDLGWPLLNDATEYHSPMAPSGAGFSVWFSASEGIAYERAGYW